MCPGPCLETAVEDPLQYTRQFRAFLALRLVHFETSPQCDILAGIEGCLVIKWQCGWTTKLVASHSDTQYTNQVKSAFYGWTVK